MFTETLNIKYKPQMALVIYKKEDTESVFSENQNIPEYHLETCQLIKQHGQYHLSAGTLLKENQLNNLASFLNKRERKRLRPYSFKGAIPSHILFTKQVDDLPTVIWIEKDVEENLLFTKALGIPDGVVKLPNLVFQLSGPILKVFAFKASQLGGNTKLYSAPFHNTQQSGVCMGTVKIKPANHYWEDLVEAAHHAFFNSLFSHIHGGNPLKDQFNLNVVLTNCIEKKTEFPVEALKSVKMNLNQLINQS